MADAADVVVVGAGPAGLMASIVAAEAGAGVTLIDRRGWTGGRLGLQRHPLQGPASIYAGRDGGEFCRRLETEALAAGVRVMPDSTVVDVQGNAPHFSVDYTTTESVVLRLTASAAVLATGSLETWPTFPGSGLRGVMRAGEAQVLVNVHRQLPGRRAIMVGSDDGGLLIAANLVEEGVEVVAVVDESPRVQGRPVNAAPLVDAGVPILTSTRLIEARGKGSVESVSVGCAGAERAIEVDTVCLAGPRTPESRLAAGAGCALGREDIFGGVVPAHHRSMATSIAGLYVCGDGAGVENGAVALETGRLAGLFAAKELGYLHPQARLHERTARGRLGYLRRGRRGLLRRQAKVRLASHFDRATVRTGS